jgi:CBS domain containing-hemolysin-like protein
MAALLGCSTFFSASEAALFYLGREDRRTMLVGGPGQRLAVQLLGAPDRLLTAILFWNLLVNLAYFALASIVGIRLEGQGFRTEAGVVTLGALLTIILFGEMIPKNVALLRPKLLAGLLGMPLSIAVRALDPIMPAFRLANLVSRRVLFPRFQREPYLEIRDLERAITLGTQDEQLAKHEQGVLQNIVALNNIRVEEIMRPRMNYELYHPPVSLSDLGGRLTPSGYVLVTEHDSDEIAAAVPLKYLAEVPSEHLEHYAEKVVYVPWSASAATALELLHGTGRDVAAVIDEHGGTIGIVTMDDILETVIRVETVADELASVDAASIGATDGDATGSHRRLQVASIVQLDEHTWEATGMTSLRRLAKRLGVELPESKAVTVAGMVHEQLQRLPQKGDVIYWNGLVATILRAPTRGRLTVRFEIDTAGGAQP